MNGSNELIAMRMICWERAKGELNAFLGTFFSIESGLAEGWEIKNKLVKDFINEMEDYL